MTREERRRVQLEQAQGWRVPAPVDLNKPLGSVRLDSLRVVDDAKAGDKLVLAGLATRFQRRTHLPRKDGRKLPTVVQLTPDGSEPKSPGRKPGRPSVRPSVEELRSLLDRIRQIEGDLFVEKTRAIG